MVLKAPSICAGHDCDRRATVRGLCRKHYDRVAEANGWRSDPGPCSVADCSKPVQSRGMCPLHYSRARRSELNPERRETRKGTPLERMLASLDVGLCWEWTGAVNKHGYGFLTLSRARWYVHRLMWTTLVGPIPKGMVIDHLCRNPPCCNPDHLEVVTQIENMRRSRADVYGRYS